MYISNNAKRKITLFSLVVAVCVLVLAFLSYYIVQRVDSPLPTTPTATPLQQEMIKTEKLSVGSPVQIIGTSVIAGHFGFKDDKPAVFDNLHKLRTGDEIYIKDSKGAVITFVVQDIKDYVPEQDATDVFDSNDGKSHLNLITCKGRWIESLKSYDTRLVVFADRLQI